MLKIKTIEYKNKNTSIKISLCKIISAQNNSS